MLVRDVFVATGGPRGLFKPKVGEVYQVSATCAIFVPVMMPEGERDPEHRDMELWQFYREVRPHLETVTFDGPPAAIQHQAWYGRSREVDPPAKYWACPERLRDALFPDGIDGGLRPVSGG